MTWQTSDNWILLIGVLAAGACALPGCYLVLRRMSLLGDAISHAVLPGLAIAFMLTQSRASLPMFLGAAVVGVLTAVLSQWVEQTGKVEASASLGVVFTALFALGLVLIRFAVDDVDLDVDCVLYGAIESAHAHRVNFLGASIPQAVLVNGGMLLINALFITFFYKELKISSFDPQLATTMGIPAKLMHYLLMALVAATVVAAFESVGAILVIAMLIVPAAAAHLLTDRMGLMLLIALVVAGAAAALGHVGVVVIPPLLGLHDTSTAGMMAVMVGLLFLLAMFLGPRYGIISRALGRLRLTWRIAEQDLLAALHRAAEREGSTGALDGEPIMAMPMSDRLRRGTERRLRRRGLVTGEGDALQLTDAGRLEARDLVRSHRLWETYLEQFAGLRTDQVHLSAERLEHVTDAQLQRTLAERTGSPDTDPQGKAIPPQREDGSAT